MICHNAPKHVTRHTTTHTTPNTYLTSAISLWFKACDTSLEEILFTFPPCSRCTRWKCSQAASGAGLSTTPQTHSHSIILRLLTYTTQDHTDHSRPYAHQRHISMPTVNSSHQSSPDNGISMLSFVAGAPAGVAAKQLQELEVRSGRE